jgi:hypothetical protein
MHQQTQLYKIDYSLVLKFPKFAKNNIGNTVSEIILNILELIFETTIATKYEKQNQITNNSQSTS